VHITPPTVADAEALTDLHLDVWEEAYAGLMPPSVFAERRVRRAERVFSWRGIIASGSSDTLLAWDDDGRLLGFSSTGPGRDDPAEGLPPLELMALYVRAEVYGSGVGHALCEAALGPTRFTTGVHVPVARSPTVSGSSGRSGSGSWL
jgi:GNAT superfamily N-acetyltransferase